MKILIFCTLIAHSLMATSDEESFLRANKLYEQREFVEAKALYEELPNKSASVFENLGNCAYYLKEYPYALLYWYKAQARAYPTQYIRISKRIDHVNKMLGITEEISWYAGIRQWCMIYMRLVPLWLWQLCMLLSWCMLLFCFVFYKRKKRILAIALTLICSGVIYIVVLYTQDASKKYAIIVVQSAQLHTGTMKSLPTVGMLQQGSFVTVKNRRDGWCLVAAQNFVGWMPSELLQDI